MATRLATIIDLAEQVADHLNQGAWSKGFTATREYQPSYELKEMGTLRVSVVPGPIAISVTTRVKYQHDYNIFVMVQQRAVLDQLRDELMALVEELADEMAGLGFEDVGSSNVNAACFEVENEPSWQPDHLREQRLFTSVLRCTFRTWRG